jgi:hypothetical protein
MRLTIETIEKFLYFINRHHMTFEACFKLFYYNNKFPYKYKKKIVIVKSIIVEMIAIIAVVLYDNYLL